MNCKEVQATFQGDGNVLCLDCGDGFMDVYNCQNSSHCVIYMNAIYCMKIIKVIKKKIIGTSLVVQW